MKENLHSPSTHSALKTAPCRAPNLLGMQTILTGAEDSLSHFDPDILKLLKKLLPLDIFHSLIQMVLVRPHIIRRINLLIMQPPNTHRNNQDLSPKGLVTILPTILLQHLLKKSNHFVQVLVDMPYLSMPAHLPSTSLFCREGVRGADDFH